MSPRRSVNADEYASVAAPGTRLHGRALGIDVGGTGIKAAVVDVASGRLLTERFRELTPRPATLEAVMAVVKKVVDSLRATGQLQADIAGGVGFPPVIRGGRAMSATNLDPSWIGACVSDLFSARLARRMAVLNDADAAGVAEVAYGAAKGACPGWYCCWTLARASARPSS